MKTRLYLLAASALLLSSSVMAQRSPEHELDITDMKFEDLPEVLQSWTPGTAPSGVSSIDDQFFISRVRPQERISGADDYVVDPTRTSAMTGRKMLMWVPLDDPTARWKALPRYCFEGDNFSLWSYVDIHGNWSAPWIRTTAGLSDAAHKNGVQVGCVMSIPWSQSIGQWNYDNFSRTFKTLMQDGYAEKFVKLLKYYGIDAVGVNSEFRSQSSFMSDLRDFFKNCHQEAEKIGWHFNLIWYDGTNDSGIITFDRGLGTQNQKMFGDKDNIVTDALFFNYNWSDSKLKASVTKAKEMGRNSFDIYAGYDIQGNALKNKNSYTRWTDLLSNEVSIGFWGAHTQSLLHQSSTDNGTSDIAIQKAYLLKQELTFSGGYRNPAFLPNVGTGTSLSNADLKNFHGLATFLTAKSTIQTVPFVTRFNLGNGLAFYNDGKVTFNSKWYNLNTQDYMPTWRWWITDADDKIAAASELDGLVDASLTFDDAWWGGSCLSLKGKTAFSRVKLFKTKLAASADERLSLVYKTIGDTQSHAKLFVALRSDIQADGTASYKEIDIPAAAQAGEWTKFETTLGKLGVSSGNVAMIGIVVENSPESYEMRVGELALRGASDAAVPTQPQIKEVKIVRGKYNSVDFKMRYASKEESGDVKTYNDEVGTWYYEIYFQQQGGEEQLLTATTSWAAYVVGAPMVSGYENRTGRFGVRAVGIDGITKSEIAWTEYRDIPYNTVLGDVEADKAIVKPNQEFTLRMKDDMAPAAKAWKVVDPVTDKVIKEATDAKEITLSIDKVGLYDLVLTDGSNNTTITRGKIQVTPESTGAVPEVLTLSSDVKEQTVGKDVKLTYTSKDGEGKVSRALVISDPNMLSIPAATEPGKTYSIGLWFRADKFAHDKQGTNLISKNSIADKWPHNNWGDLWVQIRPPYAGTTSHPANEVSFNVMGWTAHDNPNERMMSTGYSVTPKVWTHIMVTQDENGHQKMYFNGRKVAETDFPSSTRREKLAQSDSRIKASEPANIYIGGGGVYKAAFNGLVDEVQVWNKVLTDEEVLEAMKGYEDGKAPEGLQGYYTFENIESDGTFKNMGHMENESAKVVVAANTGGESTASASYEQREAHNDQMGYPGIPGSLDIKTTNSWNLGEGGSLSTEEGKVATVTYATPGTKTATLTLTNNWGADSKTLENYVIISVPSAIETVETTSGLVVVSTGGGIRLHFAEGGNYQVAFYSTSGALLQSSPVKAQAGGEAFVTLGGTKGIVLVKVQKDGRTLRSLKVNVK